MKLKSILYILMLLPFLWSCNNEDDVEEDYRNRRKKSLGYHSWFQHHFQSGWYFYRKHTKWNH